MSDVTSSGWYPDPLGVAELRWFDGVGWTDHVSDGERSWTAPLETQPAAPAAPAAPPAGSRSMLSVDDLVVARAAQPRGQGASLDVYDEVGTLGRFVESTSTELADAVIVRLEDASGAPVLSIVHPGSSARARVDGDRGSIGFLSKVGRLRTTFELHGPGRRPEGEPLVTLRPAGDDFAWDATAESGAVVAQVRSWRLGAPSDTAYGEARYALHLGPGAPPELRPLLLALPVLVDRSVTQLVH